MKQILGLDVGTVTFTPSPGANTLVFAGITGFNPSRLLAVSNVTRKTLIYAAEASGKGGAWSAVTTTGGTLTLDFDTTGYNAADVLRAIYESSEILTVPPTGRNACKGFDIMTKSAQTTRTLDYGPGPIPGTRSVLAAFNMTPDNTGLSVGIPVVGRSDGARFIFSFYTKDAGSVQTLQASLTAFSNGSAQASTVNAVPLVTSGDGKWRRHFAYLTCAICNATTVTAQVRGPSGGVATVELACPMVHQTYDGLPENYAEPSNNSPTLSLVPTLAQTSVCAWGDSLTAGANGFEWRTELTRLLNGSVIYNGGIGGETSSQIKDRAVGAIWVALTAYTLGQYRVNGSNMYKCSQAGTSAASGGPTGTGTNITDGTAKWDYYVAASTPMAANYNGVIVIWAGRNDVGVNTPASVISNIDAIVGVLTHSRYLVLSVWNQTSEPIGHNFHQQVGVMNALLAAKYGRKFVDTRSLICAGTATDIPNASLMSDAIHPNAAGHAAVALAIYEGMVRNGYLPNVPVFAPSTLTSPTVATESFTRPADILAYTIGDLVANSTTAGSVFSPAMPICFPQESVIGIRLRKSGTGIVNASFRVHLFASAPTVTNGDNGVFLPNNSADYIGYVDIANMQSFSDGAVGYGTMTPRNGRAASHGGLFYLVSALAAYTPESGETFAITQETQ